MRLLPHTAPTDSQKRLPPSLTLRTGSPRSPSLSESCSPSALSGRKYPTSELASGKHLRTFFRSDLSDRCSPLYGAHAVPGCARKLSLSNGVPKRQSRIVPPFPHGIFLGTIIPNTNREGGHMTHSNVHSQFSRHISRDRLLAFRAGPTTSSATSPQYNSRSMATTIGPNTQHRA